MLNRLWLGRCRFVSSASNETLLPICTLFTSTRVVGKPLTRARSGHWLASSSKSLLYVPFPVTFLMTAPGLGVLIECLSTTRLSDEAATPSSGRREGPPAAAFHTPGFTDQDVSPLALRAQPYKVTTYASIATGYSGRWSCTWSFAAFSGRQW